jgi:hypothetical protein
MDGAPVAIAAANVLAAKLGEGFAGEAGKTAWDSMKRGMTSCCTSSPATQRQK